MEFNKRSRTTNREQFAMLVERMKLNENIARNMSKQPAEVVSVFWTTLTTDLNALGPPTKSLAEWKKVWSDFKSSIKKKISNNRVQLQATGGGPNAEVHLTALEEEVAQLVNINDAVLGVCGRHYGTPQGMSSGDHTTSIEASNGDQIESGPSEERENAPGTSSATSHTHRRTTPRSSQMKLLKQQVDSQKSFHENVSATLRGQKRKLDDLATTVRKVEKTMANMDNNVAKMSKTLEDLVAETRRHNLAVEKLMADKTRLKQQLLEIELSNLNSKLSK